jgi:hypothetical protein
VFKSEDGKRETMKVVEDYTFFYGEGNEDHQLGTGVSYIRE